MVNTLVSIVMPLYNAERYVGRAIESVIAQTYPAWELIVVDDCSTDASVQVVRKYVDVDQRICLVQNPTPSGGPTFPRNKAIGLAKGRFIAFLDSDDIWLPTKLEEQLPLFADEDTWVVFSYYKKMDEDGHVHKRVTRPLSILSPSSMPSFSIMVLILPAPKMRSRLSSKLRKKREIPGSP